MAYRPREYRRAQEFDTVGSYTVLDYGFDIKHPDGGHSRAGTVFCAKPTHDTMTDPSVLAQEANQRCCRGNCS